MRYGYARFSVQLNVLHQIIGICLLPVSRSAVCTADLIHPVSVHSSLHHSTSPSLRCSRGDRTHTAKLAAIGIVVICLHAPRRTPRVRIERAHTIGPRFLGEEKLAAVLAVPLVIRGPARRRGTGGQYRVHPVILAALGGPDAVAEDGETSAGGGVEEEIENLGKPS